MRLPSGAATSLSRRWHQSLSRMDTNLTGEPGPARGHHPPLVCHPYSRPGPGSGTWLVPGAGRGGPGCPRSTGVEHKINTLDNCAPLYDDCIRRRGQGEGEAKTIVFDGDRASNAHLTTSRYRSDLLPPGAATDPKLRKAIDRYRYNVMYKTVLD